ncbi:MAG: DUF1573 domain-containing protein [Candidatus Doudnabacteria bacterium]|nr:DUF1573 domain-containing protein [bacterium]MDZ4243538.1 DUF1573 domain-containing protein [Candidatus Doudnabacteria bacterium]
MHNQSKNIIFGLAVAGILVGGVVLLARGGNSLESRSNPSATLTTSEQHYNFGRVSMAEGRVSHEFKIKNISGKTISLDTLSTSCMCTEAFFRSSSGVRRGPFSMPGHGTVPKLKEVLAGGEEAVVEAIFDPSAHGPAGVGPIERSVILESDDGVLEMHFSAEVIP